MKARGRFDEKMIHELVKMARVHLRAHKGEKHSLKISDADIINGWIWRVEHLPRSQMPGSSVSAYEAPRAE